MTLRNCVRHCVTDNGKGDVQHQGGQGDPGKDHVKFGGQQGSAPGDFDERGMML